MRRVIFVLLIIVLAIGVFAVKAPKTDDNKAGFEDKAVKDEVQQLNDPKYMRGIEICNVEYDCGVKDNVCPERYVNSKCKVKDPDCRRLI